MVNLVNEKFATYYHSDKMSSTFVFCFLLYFLMILVPFLISFTNDEFWIRAAYYFEQPTVTSLDQYVMVVQTTDSSYFYTNVPDIARQRSISPQPPKFRATSQSEVSLSSEKPIAQNFTINIDLEQEAKSIRFVQILIFFEYELTGNVKLAMNTFAEVSINTQGGVSYGKIIGDLKFLQRHPLTSGLLMIFTIFSDTVRRRYDYPPYYDNDGALLLDPIQMIQANMLRNESLQVDLDTWIRPSLISGKVQLSIDLKVPKYQEIIYIATLLETMKFGWVQYFSLFLIFWIFGQFLLSYVIENGVFPTYKVNDLPREPPTYSKKKLE